MIPKAMKKATSQRRTNTTLIEPRATCLPTDLHVIPTNQSPSACLKPNAMKHCMNILIKNNRSTCLRNIRNETRFLGTFVIPTQWAEEPPKNGGQGLAGSLHLVSRVQ